MNIASLADNIVQGKEGIYFSKNSSEISYPEKGNDNCFQIEDNSFWFNHRNRAIIELVKKFTANKTFFDIGGGNGFVAKGLEQNGIETILVEPGLTGALNAQRRGVTNIICSTFEDIELKKDVIESAGLFDVVEHIEKDVEFLANIGSYFQKDGCIFITVPAYNTLWSKRDDEAGHYRRYTLERMSETLKKAGFEVEYQTYIFSILPFPAFLFRTIPSKLGMLKDYDANERGKDHTLKKKGALESIMSNVWNWELKQIKKLNSISMGGSCLVVAKKM